MEKVRLGIIGLGNQGKYYTHILKGESGSRYAPDNMVIGAVCDIDPKMKALYAEKYPELPFVSESFCAQPGPE